VIDLEIPPLQSTLYLNFYIKRSAKRQVTSCGKFPAPRMRFTKLTDSDGEFGWGGTSTTR
jgi:hypothetical protein